MVTVLDSLNQSDLGYKSENILVSKREHKENHYPQRTTNETYHKWKLINFPATLMTTEDRSILYCVYFPSMKK